jgi:SAM-dependent methyltransferase
MSNYALGHTSDEARRLMRQAEYLAPHTRRALQAAGIGPGKRVLDLGAGMGDVSLLAVELGAEVVAVERDPATIERARARLAGARVEILQGTLPDIEVPGTFDVICGRLILMYLPDPAAVLRRLAQQLKPGGGVAFIEYDFRPARMLPSPALARASVEAFCRVLEKIGCHTDLGFRLPQIFTAAGLPQPTVDTLLWTSSFDDDVGHEMIQGVQLAVTPIAERVGMKHELDPDPATLPERLRAAVRAEGTLVGPAVVGVASRLG